MCMTTPWVPMEKDQSSAQLVLGALLLTGHLCLSFPKRRMGPGESRPLGQGQDEMGVSSQESSDFPHRAESLGAQGLAAVGKELR